AASGCVRSICAVALIVFLQLWSTTSSGAGAGSGRSPSRAGRAVLPVLPVLPAGVDLALLARLGLLRGGGPVLLVRCAGFLVPGVLAPGRRAAGLRVVHALVPGGIALSVGGLLPVLLRAHRLLCAHPR